MRSANNVFDTEEDENGSYGPLMMIRRKQQQAQPRTAPCMQARYQPQRSSTTADYSDQNENTGGQVVQLMLPRGPSGRSGAPGPRGMRGPRGPPGRDAVVDEAMIERVLIQFLRRKLLLDHHHRDDYYLEQPSPPPQAYRERTTPRMAARQCAPCARSRGRGEVEMYRAEPVSRHQAPQEEVVDSLYDQGLARDLYDDAREMRGSLSQAQSEMFMGSSSNNFQRYSPLSYNQNMNATRRPTGGNNMRLSYANQLD